MNAPFSVDIHISLGKYGVAVVRKPGLVHVEVAALKAGNVDVFHAVAIQKRQVVTGKSLWGSYMEILSGVSEEDLIAFPYGKSVIEGADTVESDLSALYC